MMMFRVVFAGILMGVAGLVGGASAAEYTTFSAEMKIAVEVGLEAPQSFYEFDGKTLSWRVPAEGESHYMKVTVRDLISSQPVTSATARAVVTTAKGKMVGTSITLHETWDREAPHYGANVQIPEDVTSGILAVKIDPPKGRRLGREVGDFFTKAVTAMFKGVDFTQVEEVEASDEVSTEPGRVEWPDGRRPYVEPTPYPGAQR